MESMAEHLTERQAFVALLQADAPLRKTKEFRIEYSPA